MKAMLVKQFGDPDVMKMTEMNDLAPVVDQILVEVKAAGINPKDAAYRSGAYPELKSPPFVPGIDAAGIVKKTDPWVRKFNVGDRVYVSGSLTGTYANEVLCESSQVYHLPDSYTFAEGACLGVAYATAFRAIFQRAKGIPGETILVHGASGGVGLAAVQLASTCGFNVIGTAGSPQAMEIVRREGANIVVNHHEAGYFQQILKLNHGEKVDVILEMQADLNLEKDLSLLAYQGRIVVIGGMGPAKFNISQLKGLDAAILAVSLLIAPPEDLQIIHTALQRLLLKGTIKPVIYKEFPLTEAPQAHRSLTESGHYGKIVLIP